MRPGEAFERLVEIMARLRAPGGCPWDREQTHESITPYLIEEAYEVIEAIENGDDEELSGELGDLLLQAVFHAQMAAEQNRFDIVRVLERINDKLVRRHPHVFADTAVEDSSEVLRNWAAIKAEERKHDEDRSALAGVPRGMPALLRAHRLGEKASHVGFDWSEAEHVLPKLREELAELEAAVGEHDPASVERELGDLLFAATSLARHLDLGAERALHAACDRFGTRFRRMEQTVAERNRSLTDLPPEEREQVWQGVKAQLADEEGS